MKKILISIFSAIVMVSSLSAARHDPYNGSRIYWDINSKTTLFPSGNYARIIQLQGGRLMAVAESGGGISVAYSENGGSSWTSPQLIMRSATLVPYAVPDAIQLTDGTIVVGFNPRPSAPYSDDRKFGIRVTRSTDNGKTWSDPIFVYDAQSTFSDGCWEPSFLELPSGELQCYFANENNFQTSNEQEISMSRSFDGGVTWNAPVRICYRGGSRDGMPVPILTENDEIVVIIEDNGHPNHGGFRATTVRSPLSENWSHWVDAGSSRREMIFADDAEKTFISAAPYLRKLGTSETIASWQGDHGDRKGMGESFFDMFVAVGDADARNFRSVSQPFGLSLSQHGLWNSVTALDDGTVFALSSIGDSTHGNAINVMRGRAMKGYIASFGTPEIDASFSGEDWTVKNAQQVIMGSYSTRNRATMDFLYDNENLYFYARVVDRTIYTDKVDDDGITLGLDLANCCDTYPQQGMYRIFMDANGSLKFYEGNANKWKEVSVPASVRYAVNVKSSYYDLEIAIPWDVLGCEAVPVDKLMRCFLEVRDRRDGEIVNESVPDALLRQSWTWPEFRLNSSGSSGVKVVTENIKTNRVTVNGGNVNVKSSRDIASVTLYDISGMKRVEESVYANECTLDVTGMRGVYVLNTIFADGTSERSKIMI